MARFKKLHKNDPMDDYLDSFGLYRKHTAKDGSCLFRAVSEQVFCTQAFHPEVRMACIGYLERHHKQFEEFVEGPFESHLYNLKNIKEWAGQVEITALSLMYQRDFFIYQDIGKEPCNVTENGFRDKVMLCFSNGSHYDSVYSKSFISNAAIGQSIVYEILYRGVFKMGPELEAAVEMMLHDKTYVKQRKDSIGSIGSMDSGGFDKGLGSNPDSSSDHELPVPFCKTLEKCDGETRRILSLGPPFPYKVAKALDSNIYRNVEFDVWVESKKEQFRLDQNIASGLLYIPGDRCLVRLEVDLFHAIVQELSPEKGPVTVFLEELGEKHEVPFDSLEPLPPTQTQTHQWTSNSKINYKQLGGGYYQKSNNGSLSDLDKFKGKKKYKKGKLKEVPFIIPITRSCPPLISRIHHFESTSGFSLGRGKHVSVSPNPNRNQLRFKWNPILHDRFLPRGIGNSNYNPPNGFYYDPIKNSDNKKGQNNPPNFETCDPDLQIFPPLSAHQCSSNKELSQRISPSTVSSSSTPSSQGQQSPLPTQNSSISTTQTPLSSTVSSQNSNQVPSLGYLHFPYYPFLVIPCTDTAIQLINYNVATSRDPNGSDLPLSDLPTLRFFFNLGCEYFRSTSMLQMQQQQFTGWRFNGQINYTMIPAYPVTSQGSESAENQEETANGRTFYEGMTGEYEFVEIDHTNSELQHVSLEQTSSDCDNREQSSNPQDIFLDNLPEQPSWDSFSRSPQKQVPHFMTSSKPIPIKSCSQYEGQHVVHMPQIPDISGQRFSKSLPPYPTNNPPAPAHYYSNSTSTAAGSVYMGTPPYVISTTSAPHVSNIPSQTYSFPQPHPNMHSPSSLGYYSAPGNSSVSSPVYYATQSSYYQQPPVTYSHSPPVPTYIQPTAQ